MARRRMTIKRIDPWSVLKFGAFASVVLYAVFLLVAGVVWFIVDRLQLIDQVCDIALDVGFTSCGVNAVNLFQVVALLGGMWVIVQTAVLVFVAFLHNLIADLTGGLVVGVIDDSVQEPGAGSRSSAPVTAATGRTNGGGRGERTGEPAGRPKVRAGQPPRPRRPVTRQRAEHDAPERQPDRTQSYRTPAPRPDEGSLFGEDS